VLIRQTMAVKMRRFALVLFAGAAMATVALSQENSAGSNPPASEQKQEQSADMKGCCNKGCCKRMLGKKAKASKKDKSAISGMGCCT
jgi:hypothetical protein